MRSCGSLEIFMDSYGTLYDNRSHNASLSVVMDLYRSLPILVGLYGSL